MKQSTVQDLTLIFSQLQGAHLDSPWLWAVGLGVLLSGVRAIFKSPGWFLRVCLFMMTVLIGICGIVLCTLYTEVNSIRLVDMLMQVIPVLDVLL